MRKRVVITGIGWVTPLGHDIETVWKRLLAGESGIAPTTLFDARTFPTTFAAEVKNYNFSSAIGPSYPRHKDAGRNSQFALGAATQAWKMAGLDKSQIDPYSVGTYTGAGEGGLDFDNFTRTSLASWKDDARCLDTQKWAASPLKPSPPCAKSNKNLP